MDAPSRAPRGAPLDLLRSHEVEIRRAGLRRGVWNVRVFGSTVRGEETDESDVDLLVEFDAESRGLLPLVGFAADVAEMVGREVDATTLDLLREEIRQRVEAEAVPL